MSNICILNIYYFHLLDPINILNSGGDVENNSVINDFGDNSILILTCVTTDGLGEPNWMMMSESGNAVIQKLNTTTSYMSILSVTNPSNDFATNFSCRSSNDNSLYKEILVTRGT